MATETAHEERERRAGKNQSLFREVNERERENDNGLWLAFVCECADETCEEEIELTPEEYEKVRESATHFAVAPGDRHVVPDVERVLAQHQRYWVVEKVGVAAVVAEHLDLRSRGDHQQA
jgi:hypothetical protein